MRALLAVCAAGLAAIAGVGVSRVSPRAPAAAVADSNAVPNALPFTLQFTKATWRGPALPALQSYTTVSVKGTWLVFGGRHKQGLHMFQSGKPNFPFDSSNMWLWAIDPRAQRVDSFPVRSLPATLWPILASTNQQSYFDAATGRLIVIGGYGWKADSSDMQTFGHLTYVDAPAVIAGIRNHESAATMASHFTRLSDPRFAVTGGSLLRLPNGVYMLAFGQLFNGQYRPFGGKFTQEYTNAIAQFTLAPGATPKVLSYTKLTTSDSTQPYHRRDGNFIDDINPVTGAPRIAGYGGVFRPGVIGGYVNVVYADANGAKVDNTLSQRFNQYEAPVISAWDSTGKATYHTFFGGIGATYYHETAKQHAVFDTVTKQGRNDGLPFVADVSTLVTSAKGYTEWIHVQPTTPDTLLVGASAEFIPDDSVVASGLFTKNGHVRLNALKAGQSVRLGWIYGGIQADNPFPVFPSTGTAATNLLMEVRITKTASAAIPASKGTTARPSKVFQHDR